MSKFKFPDDAWDCSLTPEADGYVAMWKDHEGSHIWELTWDEVDEVEPYTEEDYADGYISDPGAWYKE